MLKRYALPSQSDAEHEFALEQPGWIFSEHFNVTHFQLVPAVRAAKRKTTGVMLRWGLIPSWAKGRPTERSATAVPLEELRHSRYFRIPWLDGQRCILPAAGFYLWRLTDEQFRQPYFLRLTSRSVFGIAAIWNRSTTKAGEAIESCAIVTVPANALIAEIRGPDRRMPAVLRRKDYERWLTGTSVAAKSVLHSYPAEWMQAYAVSPRVNSAEHNDRELIQPLALD
jgi:putative SOS response-associated peptidase YedK